MYSMNVGRYQWNQLLRPSYMGREELISDVDALGRRSVLRAMDFSEGECPRVVDSSKRGVSRGSWFFKRSVLGNSCVMFSERSFTWCTLLSVFKSFWWDGQVSWSWYMSEIDYYRCPLCSLFFQSPGRKSEVDWFGSDSGSWGIACTPKGLVKISFRILSPLWKLE